MPKTSLLIPFLQCFRMNYWNYDHLIFRNWLHCKMVDWNWPSRKNKSLVSMMISKSSGRLIAERTRWKRSNSNSITRLLLLTDGKASWTDFLYYVNLWVDWLPFFLVQVLSKPTFQSSDGRKMSIERRSPTFPWKVSCIASSMINWKTYLSHLLSKNPVPILVLF